MVEKEVAGEKGGVRRRKSRGEKGGGRESCRRSRGGRHGRKLWGVKDDVREGRGGEGEGGRGEEKPN